VCCKSLVKIFGSITCTSDAQLDDFDRNNQTEKPILPLNADGFLILKIKVTGNGKKRKLNFCLISKQNLNKFV